MNIESGTAQAIKFIIEKKNNSTPSGNFDISIFDGSA